MNLWKVANDKDYLVFEKFSVYRAILAGCWKVDDGNGDHGVIPTSFGATTLGTCEQTMAEGKTPVVFQVLAYLVDLLHSAKPCMTHFSQNITTHFPHSGYFNRREFGISLAQFIDLSKALNDKV